MIWLARILVGWYTQVRSVDVLQATGSLLLQSLLCCLAVLYSCLNLSLNGKSLCCESSVSGLLRWPVHYVNSKRYTVTIKMAKDGRPSGDRSGSGFEMYFRLCGMRRSPS